MKRIFQLTAVAVMLMFMSAPAAWSATYGDHVSQAPNGKGDVLIYPTYFAFEGFQTKIQVINTSPNASAIAKVVIRSPQWSLEILDFFIFLTPTDVWEGYLMWDGNQAVIYSEDDSVLIDDAPTFASAGSPLIQPLEMLCDDFNIYGYAEVFLTHVFPANFIHPVTGATINLTSPVVSKDDLYDAFIGGGSLAGPQPRTGAVPAIAAAAGFNINILAGNLQIQSPLQGWTSAMNAVTLKDYRIDAIQNILIETAFGFNARNNIMEVEAALSKNDIGMPFINNEEGATLHFFNFPTKLTRLDDECRIEDWLGEYVGFEGFNFSNGRWESVRVQYNSALYDQEENTRTPERPIFSPAPQVVDRFLNEVDFLSPGFFDKGWVRYGLTDGPTPGVNLANQPLAYSGAPVIPFTMNWGDGGFSTMYGFYSNGEVQGLGPAGVPVPLRGYQYVRVTPGT